MVILKLKLALCTQSIVLLWQWQTSIFSFGRRSSRNLRVRALKSLGSGVGRARPSRRTSTLGRSGPSLITTPTCGHQRAKSSKAVWMGLLDWWTLKAIPRNSSRVSWRWARGWRNTHHSHSPSHASCHPLRLIMLPLNIWTFLLVVTKYPGYGMGFRPCYIIEPQWQVGLG